MPIIKLYKDILFFCFSSILGLSAFIVTAIRAPEAKWYNSPLFPIIATGVENYSWFTFYYLIIVSTILGLIRPNKAWLWGLGTIFLLPILSIIEVIVDPYSHNLLPIEFICYIIMTIPCLVASIGAAFINKTIMYRIHR